MTDRELIAKHRAACGECERVLAGQSTFCTIAKFIETPWWGEDHRTPIEIAIDNAIADWRGF